MNDFKSLPKSLRAAIIHKIISVGALSAPRLKSWKDMDQENYERGYKRKGSYHKGLFDVILHQAKTGTI